MPTTIAQFITDVANAKNTGSGKVEWNGNSLQSIMVNDIAPLFLNRGLAQVADTTALQALSGSESKAAGIDGVGLFFWASSGTPNGSTIFSASGDGVWKKQNVVQTPSLATLSDVQLTSPSNGQFLAYQTGKWVNSNASISVSALSDVDNTKLNGYVFYRRFGLDGKYQTSPYVRISDNIGFSDFKVTGTIEATSHLVVGGNLTVSGLLTLGGSLSVSGTLSAVGNFAIATNKFTVAAASGNTVVAGTLTVAGVSYLDDSVNIGYNGSGGLNVYSGNVQIGTNLSVDGDTFLGNLAAGDTSLASLSLAGNLDINTNKFTVAYATGNTVVAGTLGVGSDLTINTNKFTVAAVSGNTTIAGTLGVTGNFAVATNKFTVAASTGNTVVAGTLTVQNASLVVAAPSTSDQLAMTNSSIVLPASASTSFGTISTGLNSPVALKWDLAVTTTGLTLKTTEYFPIYVNGVLKKVALTN